MSPHRRGSATRTVVALLCVLLVACGGTRDPGPTAELDTEDPFGDEAARLADPASRGADDDRLASEDAPGPSLRSETTAPVRPRLDRAAGDPPPLEPVTPQRPAVRVDDVTGDVLPQVLGIDGVRFATVVSLGELALEDGPLRVVAVEPFGFRQVVPAVTADSAGVWDRLAGGEVVLDPPAGRGLGVGPGEGLQTADGGTVTVGAWASHADPALADALMTHATADGLGVVGTQTVLVTLHDGVRAADVTGRLEALDLGEVTALDDGAVHTARLVGTDAATVAAFEPFRYVDAEDGRITVDPDWVDRHVVTAAVPVLGEVTCHRELFAPLRVALQRIVDEGLEDRLDADDYGGCYAPRHIDRNEDANLSMHAWGLAVDVNVATNPLGAEPQMDPGVVAAFIGAGFAWGGAWERPDGMHFELERL